MPKLLTRKEYQAHFRVTRQAVSKAIARGTLKTVIAPVETKQEMIVVDDHKYELAVKAKSRRKVDTGKQEE